MRPRKYACGTRSSENRQMNHCTTRRSWEGASGLEEDNKVGTHQRGHAGARFAPEDGSLRAKHAAHVPTAVKVKLSGSCSRHTDWQYRSEAATDASDSVSTAITACPGSAAGRQITREGHDNGTTSPNEQTNRRLVRSSLGSLHGEGTSASNAGGHCAQHAQRRHNNDHAIISTNNCKQAERRREQCCCLSPRTCSTTGFGEGPT